jgi:hypothetical protein
VLVWDRKGQIWHWVVKIKQKKLKIFFQILKQLNERGEEREERKRQERGDGYYKEDR